MSHTFSNTYHAVSFSSGMAWRFLAMNQLPQVRQHFRNFAIGVGFLIFQHNVAAIVRLAKDVDDSAEVRGFFLAVWSDRDLHLGVDRIWSNLFEFGVDVFR